MRLGSGATEATGGNEAAGAGAGPAAWGVGDDAAGSPGGPADLASERGRPAGFDTRTSIALSLIHI